PFAAWTSSFARRRGPTPRRKPCCAVSTCRSQTEGGESTSMAKTSSINKNQRREALTKKFAAKRRRLKALAEDRSLAPEERFAARLKLAELPRNGSATRIRNRCALTGRPRGNYRKFKLSRIALRELASQGQI